METNMLQFIRNISDSDEEFLAIIEEINRWIANEEEQNRSHTIYLPANLGRINFSRDEYRKAIRTSRPQGRRTN
ncbi:MAG: hypothetical protein ACRCVW_03040 [Brevinema sp.]